MFADPSPDIARRRIPDGMAFSHWLAPDGWALRRFRWPADGTPRGSLLFLGGRGDFVEKYLEALRHWHDGGWDLAGFDWRGQGGSGRHLADPLICHMPDFDALLDDLDAFVREWRKATPGPHAIIAHSMGAHLTLRLMAERGVRLDRAALLSPMIAIAVKRLPSSLAFAAAHVAVALGRGERRIWEGDLGNYGGRMSSCENRQADKLWWKAERPEIASGAPSWGWLKAACSSSRKLPMARLATIDTPLLLLASRRDPVIDIGAVRRAAATLPRATHRLFDGTGHELLREADRVRLPVLAAIDAFL